VKECEYRRDFVLEMGFIDHFTTQHVTTFNYSAIVVLRTLQITTEHLSLFVYCVSNGRSLVTASNSGDASASAFASLLIAPTRCSLHILTHNPLSAVQSESSLSYFTTDGLPQISSS
jgi:hypothetical protein